MQPNNLTIDSTFTLLSGNKIPLIGYGTYVLEGDDCIKGTTWALECGYTHIDTASIYRNEAQLSKVIHQAKIPRQKLYITSKVNPSEQGYKQSRKAVEGILNRLKLTYLDLILIHWPGVSKVPTNSQKNREIRLETWKTFLQLKKEGKVKDVGVSNFLTHHLQHLIQNTPEKPSVNQIQIHPLLWEESTINFCRKQGIAIQAYSPLARNDQKLFKNDTMLQIAKKYNKSIAQISLRWCLQHGFIILPKSKTKSRIKQNIDIYDFNLDNDDMNKINNLSKSIKVRTCWDPNSIKY